MRITLTILLVIIRTVLSNKQPCSNEASVELTNRMYNGTRYIEGEYFVDDQTGIERGCLCMKVTCARKCCPFGQVFNMTSRNCQASTILFNPTVSDEFTEVKEFNVTKEFHIIEGKVICDSSLGEERHKIYPLINFKLRTDGNLFVDNSPYQTIFGPEKYCIDTFLDDPEIKEDGPVLNVLLCYSEEETYNHYEISSTCMLVSCFFMLLTVCVYAWLPELRNFQGMVHIAYLLSFFIGFLFMASLQIMILADTLNSLYCQISNFIIYFFILSAFFWLNVMCFDIWWVFSGKRGQRLISDNMSTRKRFLKYSAYAVGIPAMLTVLLAILEYSDLPDHPLLPNILKVGCFMGGESRFLYLYGPITIQIMANLILFILTALNIANTRKQTKQAMSSSENSVNNHHKNETHRFVLYVKLFSVTGFTWILEVVSYLYPEAETIWKYTDAYNVLFGVLIFIIFICKKSVFKMIMKRCKGMDNSSRFQIPQTMTTAAPTKSQ